MALDHGRLGVENKFLENKSGRMFTFDKFALENLANKSGCVQINLLYFLYITSEVEEYYEVLFLSHRPPDLRQFNYQSVSQFFKTNSIHSIFRTIEARVGF